MPNLKCTSLPASTLGGTWCHGKIRFVMVFFNASTITGPKSFI